MKTVNVGEKKEAGTVTRFTLRSYLFKSIN
jgi:hypothetical protein